jgi:5-carboxymethyl-2-hydroxymuconate isomerase
MKSRNSREGRYCGRTPAPDGSGRRHIRSRTRQVSAGAAIRAVLTRIVAEAEERRQIALVAHIRDEDGDVVRELAWH